jgi:hypothetical protein
MKNFLNRKEHQRMSCTLCANKEKIKNENSLIMGAIYGYGRHPTKISQG